MPEQEVAAYIKKALAQGQSKEVIYKDLLDQGLTLEKIQELFNNIKLNTAITREKEETTQKTIRAIVGVGILLIGIGVVVFICSSWANLSQVWQVLVLLLPMLAAEIVGWWLKRQKNLINTGEAFILLGLILYGVNLFVLPLVFHATINITNKLSLWLLGSILMAYASESLSLLYLAIILSVALFLTGIKASQSIFSIFLLIAVTIIMFLIGLNLHRKASLINKQ